MAPIQRVNVDFTASMLQELDHRAEELNISRQAVIKTMLRHALDQHYLARSCACPSAEGQSQVRQLQRWVRCPTAHSTLPKARAESQTKRQEKNTPVARSISPCHTHKVTGVLFSPAVLSYTPRIEG